MIAYLEGKILGVGDDNILVLVSGLGYKVFVPVNYLSELNLDNKVVLYIYQHVREDSLSLYGFLSSEELNIFELLLSISGIGPKSALGAVAISSVDEMVSSISRGDSSLLEQVSGIGKKTAKKVVLDLQDKISKLYGKIDISQLGSKSVNVKNDEIDALLALGYFDRDARSALSRVNPDTKDFSERIKEALKFLSQ